MRVDETIQQAEAIVRFAQEVDRRLAEFGVNGASDLVALLPSARRRPRAAIELTEIEWASRETAVAGRAAAHAG